MRYSFYKYSLFFLLITTCYSSFAQSQISAKPTLRAITSDNNDLFNTHEYIENIGQYGETLPGYGYMGKILYGYEGFGMPILEAQAVGRAVISSNLFSMPEVAGDSAVLVDPFNIGEIRSAILKIISDDTFREDRIRKGFENIKRFDPELIANQYFGLYEMIYKSNS